MLAVLVKPNKYLSTNTDLDDTHKQAHIHIDMPLSIIGFGFLGGWGICHGTEEDLSRLQR